MKLVIALPINSSGVRVLAVVCDKQVKVSCHGREDEEADGVGKTPEDADYGVAKEGQDALLRKREVC